MWKRRCLLLLVSSVYAPNTLADVAPITVVVRGLGPVRAVRGAVGATGGTIAATAVARLPEHTRVPSGGAMWHLGVFSDARRWDAFARSIGFHGFSRVQFSQHFVVYAVFDTNTHSLEPSSWGVDASGEGTLSVRWDRASVYRVIPPHQASAVFMLVPRANVRSVRLIATGHDGEVARFLLPATP